MVENLLDASIPLIASLLELVGVFIIALAGLKGTYEFIKGGFDFGHQEIPIELAKAMSLSLSFLLSAEILLTILVRSIEGLIVLVGIAGLRVGLHFVLQLDLKENQKNSKIMN